MSGAAGRRVGTPPRLVSTTAAPAFLGHSAYHVTGLDYDANGNTIAESRPDGSVVSYTWDGEDRLVGLQSATESQGFAYDADGLRRRRVTAAGTTEYLWDGQNLLAELDEGLATTTRQTDFPGWWGGLSSRWTAAGSAHYTHDLSANTRQVLDGSGAATATAVYTAFGTALAAADGPVGFGGQVGYYQDETERLYVRARHYRPGVGRWLARDPLGRLGGASYGYGSNAPVGRLDPTGLEDWRDSLHRSIWGYPDATGLPTREPVWPPSYVIPQAQRQPMASDPTVTFGAALGQWSTWGSGLATSTLALLETGYDAVVGLGEMSMRSPGSPLWSVYAGSRLYGFDLPTPREFLDQHLGEPLFGAARRQPGYTAAKVAWTVAQIAGGTARGCYRVGQPDLLGHPASRSRPAKALDWRFWQEAPPWPEGTLTKYGVRYVEDPRVALKGRAVTDYWGRIRVAPGLTEVELREALLHEKVHSWLTPGRFLHDPRAAIAREAYESKAMPMFRYTEEWLAQFRATGSFSAANAHVLKPAYDINVAVARWQLGTYSLGVGGLAYRGYRLSSDYLEQTGGF